jgi:hypothetical protein
MRLGLEPRVETEAHRGRYLVLDGVTKP